MLSFVPFGKLGAFCAATIPGMPPATAAPVATPAVFRNARRLMLATLSDSAMGHPRAGNGRSIAKRWGSHHRPRALSRGLTGQDGVTIWPENSSPRRITMDAWTTTPAQAAERVSAFLWKVYSWMAIGLGLPAVGAFAVAGSPELIRILVGNRLVFFGLVIAELGLVFYLSARAASMAPGTAAGLFALYSALNGVTLSVVLLAYTGESVTTTFVVTAGMFGALALFGSTTKRSLAGFGQFFMMGLVGLILASLVGMFLHSDALQFLISVVGLIVFTGLTAWDAQRLNEMASAVHGGQAGGSPHVGC